MAGIVERYGPLHFEPRAGVSLMEGVLFGMAMLRNKLSVVMMRLHCYLTSGPCS